MATVAALLFMSTILSQTDYRIARCCRLLAAALKLTSARSILSNVTAPRKISGSGRMVDDCHLRHLKRPVSLICAHWGVLDRAQSSLRSSSNNHTTFFFRPLAPTHYIYAALSTVISCVDAERQYGE